MFVPCVSVQNNFFMLSVCLFTLPSTSRALEYMYDNWILFLDSEMRAQQNSILTVQ